MGPLFAVLATRALEAVQGRARPETRGLRARRRAGRSRALPCTAPAAGVRRGAPARARWSPP